MTSVVIKVSVVTERLKSLLYVKNDVTAQVKTLKVSFAIENMFQA